MAHELAHILGSWHDGEPARREMTGHPGGANCLAKDGYLMGDWTHTPNEYRLSKCTKEQIQFNFRRLPLECIKLRNQASVTNNYYPGQVLDLLTYCQVLHPDIPDISANDDVCRRVDLGRDIRGAPGGSTPSSGAAAGIDLFAQRISTWARSRPSRCTLAR
ncbi:hypothetical protein MRX96_017621 [Rhipicephalus microplus]